MVSKETFNALNYSYNTAQDKIYYSQERFMILL